MTVFPTEQIVDAVTAAIYEKEPELLDRYGERGKVKCKEDNHHHFNHLKTAYELKDLQIFTDYVIWLNGILQKHGMKAQHLIDNFIIIEKVLQEYDMEDQELVSAYQSYLQAGIEALKG